MFVVVFVFVFAMMFVLVLAFTLALVARLVFPGPDEVNRPVARVVLMAMRAPVLGMAGWNVQVDRFHHHVSRRWFDNYRLRIDHSRRRPVGEVHAAINPGQNFATDRHADIHVSGVRQRRDCHIGESRQNPVSDHLTHQRSSKLYVEHMD
jgi:hypothetical protein